MSGWGACALPAGLPSMLLQTSSSRPNLPLYSAACRLVDQTTRGIMHGMLRFAVQEAAGAAWVRAGAPALLGSASTSLLQPSVAASAAGTSASAAASLLQQSRSAGTASTSSPSSLPAKAASSRAVEGLVKAGVPRVLLSNPWRSLSDAEAKKQLTRDCLELLRSTPSDRLVSGAEVHQQLASSQAWASKGLSKEDTISALEHLRYKRLAVGCKNRASILQQGHPDYPYLYRAQPYQVRHRGPPDRAAKLQAEQKEREIQQALKRLRRRKSPFPIHRAVAKHSSYQHALAHEAFAVAEREAQQHGR